MTNEIKEILQLIGSCCYYGKISEVECEKYCNYITNLQKTQETLIKNDNEIITNLQQRIDKALDMIDLIIPELWNISNNMTYKLQDVRRTLRGDE